MTTKPRTGLGRGLGDLIRPTGEPDTTEVNPTTAGDDQASLVPAPAGAAFREIDVVKVTTNPKQPRSVFDEDELAELSASIQEVGLLQPIVVRPVGDG